MSVLATRLKEARLRAGLTQEQLGIAVGLDENSASARMNRYELGKRVPNPELVAKFGLVLGVPTSYFYAEDDYEAEILRLLARLSVTARKRAIEFISSLAKK